MTMGKPDITYECHEGVTSYRLSPNPDAEPGVGYRHGAILVWGNDGDWNYQSQFFIGPESMEALGLALLEAAKDHET